MTAIQRALVDDLGNINVHGREGIVILFKIETSTAGTYEDISASDLFFEVAGKFRVALAAGTNVYTRQIVVTAAQVATLPLSEYQLDFAVRDETPTSPRTLWSGKITAYGFRTAPAGADVEEGVATSYSGASVIVQPSADEPTVVIRYEGPVGDGGWSPVLSVASGSGVRKVLQITGWVGGDGTEPETGYVAAGGVVADIEDADDLISSADIAAITAEGTTQVSLVNDAGSTQVSTVNIAGGSQVSAVNTAGSDQVSAVNAAGALITDAGGTIDVRENEALEALDSATVEHLSDIALSTVTDVFDTAADGVSSGVIGTTGLVAGSGGTNGTFDLAFSGGAGTGAAGRFTVAGGAVTSIVLTAPGVNYTSAPTVSFSASSGLTGASVTAQIGARTNDGEFYLVKGNGTTVFAYLYKNVTGTGTLVSTYPDYTALSGLIGMDTTLANLIESQTIGLSGTPITGTNLGNRTYVLGTAVTLPGRIQTLRVYCTVAGSLMIKVFSGTPGALTQVGSDYSVSISVGVNTLTAANFGTIPVSAGNYIGVYASGLIAVTTNSNVGYYDNAGNVSSVTDSTLTTTSRIEIGFDVVGAHDLSAVKGVADSAYAIAAGSALETIGRPVATPPADGIVGSAHTFVYANAATVAGAVGTIRVYANAAGTLYPKVFSKSGNDFTLVSDSTISIPLAIGLNTFTVEGGDFDGLDVAVGQHLGYYAGTAVEITSATCDSGGYYQATSTNANTTFTDSTIATTFRPEISFDIVDPVALAPTRVAALEQRVQDLEDGAAPSPALPTTWVSFLVGGQSNGDGRGSGTGTTPTAGTALMWDSGTSSLVALADPTGNTGSSAGSAWCAFATEFFERTGMGVVIINMAVGGTSIVSSGWSSGGSQRAAAVAAVTAAHAALVSGGYAYQFGGVLWSQGETDADSIDAATLTAANYTIAFNTLLAYFRANLPGGAYFPFIISQTGTKNTGDTTGYAQVRAEQRTWAQTNANVYLGWTGAVNLYTRGMMQDTYHYNQDALNEMGVSNAVVAAAVSLGRA